MADVSLNFKDVMIAKGIIGGGVTRQKGTSPFGPEGTGYITEVGSEVTNVYKSSACMRVLRVREFCVYESSARRRIQTILIRSAAGGEKDILLPLT